LSSLRPYPRCARAISARCPHKDSTYPRVVRCKSPLLLPISETTNMQFQQELILKSRDRAASPERRGRMSLHEAQVGGVMGDNSYARFQKRSILRGGGNTLDLRHCSTHLEAAAPQKNSLDWVRKRPNIRSIVTVGGQRKREIGQRREVRNGVGETVTES
jgi:hypothetical protein